MPVSVEAKSAVTSLSNRVANCCLAVLVAAFLGLGLAFARATPAWQAPDEPAQYNYVAYLATTGQLPVLRPGDYPDGRVPIGPQVRLADISAFRYEAHQPPLFYAVEAIAFKLHPTILALRALSVLFGAALLPVAYLCARRALPGRAWLQLGIVAFVAFVPMHLFVAGSIENDSLADLVLSLLLLAYLAGWPAAAVGGLLGVAALTKVTIYLPAVLLGAAAVLRRAKGGSAAWSPMTGPLGRAAIAGGAALVVCAWWFVRNGLTYGWSDFTVQGRQAQVAASQTQTGVFGARQLENIVATGFHSFWGQFGWMSIPLPERDYRVLIAFTAICFTGWLALAWRKSWPLVPGALLGMGLAWAGTVTAVLIYNLKFVQPQGRYLFPALVPIGVFYVIGFAALFPRRAQPVAVAALTLALVGFSAYALQRVVVPAFG